MNFKIAILAAAILLPSATMYADSVTVHFGQSNQDFTLIGTGGSNGYGTYLAQVGSCSIGASDTTCTLSGNYSGTTAGYTSGSYELVTTYANAEGGLPAISQDPVNPPNGGNFFNVETPFDSDVQMFLNLDDVSGDKIIPIVVNGNYLAGSYFINFIDPVCGNLPPGVSCTQGNVGLYKGDTYSGDVSGDFTFNTPAPVPEPGWLAFGGMVPGLVVAIRRRFTRTV